MYLYKERSHIVDNHGMLLGLILKVSTTLFRTVLKGLTFPCKELHKEAVAGILFRILVEFDSGEKTGFSSETAGVIL